jgi:two-component system CheB/CheR fusion protein
LFEKYIQVIEKNIEYQGEVNLGKNSSPAWLQVYAKKLGDGLIISHFDITNRKRSDEELLRLKLEQQREVLNAILIAQEKERERIGEGLHNGIGQLLYAALMKLEQAKDGEAESNVSLTEAYKIVRDAINDVRNLSFQLIPSVLRDFGLPSAVSAMINRLISPKTKIKLEIDGLDSRLSNEIEFSAYRIIQELLNNCIKHADATEIIVKLKSLDGIFLIEVGDNGKGFEPEQPNVQKGVGLQCISNRVKLLQAKMEITSSTGKGMLVKMEINKAKINE